MGPAKYLWDGEAMRPLKYFRNRVAEYFKAGVVYDMVEVEQRNMNAHRGFFAAVNSAWENLREEDADRFPTSEHLRKWALTYTPFCSVRSYQAASGAEAMRVAEFLQHDAQFSRVEIKGRQVWHFIPSSQAVDAMPNNRIFMASKKAVLIVLAQRLGIDVDTLEAASRSAA